MAEALQLDYYEGGDELARKIDTAAPVDLAEPPAVRVIFLKDVSDATAKRALTYLLAEIDDEGLQGIYQRASLPGEAGDPPDFPF